MKTFLPSPLVVFIVLLTTISFTTYSQEGAKNTLNPTIENAPPTPLCPNEEITLSTQEYDTYQWYRRYHSGTSQPIPGATGREFAVQLANQEFYYVSVRVTLNGQEASSPEVLLDQYVFSMKLSAQGENIWQDMWGGLHMCEGNYQLTLNIKDSHNFYNYQWYCSGEALVDATSDVLEVTKSGYYTATANHPFCPDLLVYSDDAFDISIHNPEPPVVTQQGDSLLANWNIGQWYYEEEPLPGATHWVLIPENEGYYAFEYERDGCPARSEPIMFSTTSIADDLNMQSEVKIYPVPASDQLNIKTPGHFSSYQIIDKNGKIVKADQLQSNAIKIGELENGIYYIRLSGNTTTTTKSFIKAN
ncbi:MAG: T9SS type A sorting domain-containing protein [Bacteroidota bacterium]